MPIKQEVMFKSTAASLYFKAVTVTSSLTVTAALAGGEKGHF
jgi:hypothetical protein